MNIEITDQQEAHAKEFGLEVIYVISNKGTFLHPELTEDELEIGVIEICYLNIIEKLKKNIDYQQDKLTNLAKIKVTTLL